MDWLSWQAAIGWLVLGAVCYGITAFITKDDLISGLRQWAWQQRTRVVEDDRSRLWWRGIVHYLEQVLFCTWCLSYWVALVLVLWQTELQFGWQALMAAFAVRTVALVLHVMIKGHDG